jgi:peptidoglycan/xylan/chitin deacetylase (PgdA/CDA1 family)
MTEASAASPAGARDARWRPAPAVRISAVVHAASAGALVVHPESWPWITGMLGCNWLGLLTAVFFPRGRLLGPNLVRLPEAAARRGEIGLTFDDGPHPQITPRVLDLLDRHGAKASFFCVGEKVAAHPEVARDIARRGHSVESHSHRHSNAFALYGLGRLRRDVQAAQAVIAGVTGREPRFFRAPAGFRSVLVDPVLAALGLRYVSWTRRGFDTVDRNAARVLRRLTRGLAAGDILVLHDRVPWVLEVLPLLLDRLDAQGLKPVSLPAACGDGPAP